jgi:hypothetical protein
MLVNVMIATMPRLPTFAPPVYAPPPVIVPLTVLQLPMSDQSKSAGITTAHLVRSNRIVDGFFGCTGKRLGRKPQKIKVAGRVAWLRCDQAVPIPC